MPDLTFTTHVSGENTAGEIEIRGVPLSKLTAQANFPAALFLMLTGRTPQPAEEKLFNALLTASLTHGISPASGFVPRVVAASGNDILTAMASTLLALGPYHGGAVKGAMEVFQEIAAQEGNVEKNCQNLIDQYRADKKRLPGFGHRKYRDVDPRTDQLFKMARAKGLDMTYVNIAETLETQLEQTIGRKLVLNIDGALAALLTSFGLSPSAGNAVFALARVAGSIAHIVEEQESGEWVRRIPEEAIGYSTE